MLTWVSFWSVAILTLALRNCSASEQMNERNVRAHTGCHSVSTGRRKTRNFSYDVEGRGKFRTFLLDNSGSLNRSSVTTHVSPLPVPSAGHAHVREEAGEIHKSADGIEASIIVTSGRGFSTSTDLIRLSGVFRNEVDALIAIAVRYDSTMRRGS